MSRETPKTKYQTKVMRSGNSARIKAYKKHIGKVVQVEVLDGKY